MIREDGLTRFDCDGGDGCRANYEFDNESYGDAWREARASGWVICVAGGGTWRHYCPKCKVELGDD